MSLPHNKKRISELIEVSEKSFAGELPIDKSKYLFVAEDLYTGNIAGSSQIKAKKGSVDDPAYAFELIKKERFSKDLGIGFIHQVLKLKITTNGQSEIGGLVVDQSYRKRPEKVGKLLSLARFQFIGMHKDYFSDELLSEMAPPLLDDGRSEFWQSLGARFTGMPYQEADRLSHQNKEFIRSLFPEEEIYLCLLDPQARLVLGQVNELTRPALAMLEKVGFKYKDEVDPFDGGPHLGVKVNDVSLIKSAKNLSIHKGTGDFSGLGLISPIRNGNFKLIQSSFNIGGDKIYLPERALEVLEVSEGDQVCFTEI